MTYVKNLGRMQDDNLLLLDSTSAITADALATVGGAAANGIVDIGAVPCAFDVVFDISAVDVASNDELYELQILGSNSSSFASGVVLLGVLMLGAKEAAAIGSSTGGIDTDKEAGKYIETVRNYIGSTSYRYVRLNIEVTGTSPSITFNPDGVKIAQVYSC